MTARPPTAPHAARLDELTSYANLEAAWRRARRGKRGTPQEVAFFFDYELRLLELQRALRERRWEPDPYRYFRIRAPKARTICVASFRDRVVHHALVGALEPIFLPAFHRHSYACTKEKGTHRALSWCRHYAARFPWFLKLDVDKYFDHIDHGVLLDLLAERVADHGVRWLCATILARAWVPSSPDPATIGIPIGNLTSQFWGNVFLDPLDRLLAGTRAGRIHLRYMDDVICFGHTKGELWETHDSVATFLRRELRLRLKPSATILAPVRDGVPFLGHRVFSGTARLDGAAKRRMRSKAHRTQQAGAAGELDEAAVAASLAASFGHAAGADTLLLRRDIARGLAEGHGCSVGGRHGTKP